LKVVGYICSSIGDKVDKTLEIKIQKEQIEKFCKEHNFKLLRFYIDQPVEPDYEKPELSHLIDDSTADDFERVIVLKFDRISFDKNFKQCVYEELKKNSKEVFSITEHTVLTDPTKEKSLDKVNNVLKKVRDIPSLPEVVTKVMELVSNPNSSAAELSRVIAHDPGLTTRVLRLVNSAYYGFPKQISSIQQSIMILGFTTMRGLVLSTSIFKIFSPKDAKAGKTLDYKEFWKHSIATALCARLIANNLGITEGGEAFSCGILHDIGKVVFDQYGHSDYVEVFKLLGPRYTSEEMIRAEEEIIGMNHANIGYKLADKWNLPESLSETIRCHHNPLDSVSNTKLVSIIYLANIFSNIISKPYEFMNIERFDPNVLDYLNIDQDKLFMLFNESKQEVESGGGLESFFE